MNRVLIADAVSPTAAAVFRERGIAVDHEPGMGPGELADRIGSYDGVVVRSATRIGADVLGAATRLRVIGRAGVGVDNIDVAAATARGVVVMNSPYGNSITTAEHAIAMLLALARQIPAADRSTRSGGWHKSRFLGVEVAGKVLGLIGCGNIGSIVADRAQGMRMRVLAYDPFLATARAEEVGVEKVPLDDLLARSDFISLHTPLTDQTRGILDADALAKSKRGVWIVNCARGGLVVEDDLLAALESGHVAGAALDVFAEEPAINSPLFAQPTVIATPHLGAATTEAHVNVAVQIAEQVSDFLAVGAITNALNMPSVSAEDAPRLRPYMHLAEQLGSFAGQIAEPGLDAVRIEFEGHVATLNTRPLSAVVLAELLSPLLDSVNMVNAPIVARNRNIDITESVNESAGGYVSLIRVSVRAEERSWSLAGTLFGEAKPWVVEIDGISIEAELGSHMLYIINADKPGFVGSLGTILAQAGVNIATLHLGRKVAGGKAVTLVEVDGPVSEDVMSALLRLPLVERAESLRFNRPARA